MRLDLHIAVVTAALIVVVLALRQRLHELNMDSATVRGYAALTVVVFVTLMAATRAFDMWRTAPREAALYLGQNIGLGLCAAAFLAIV